MATTRRLGLGIATVIGGTLLLIAPLDASAVRRVDASTAGNSNEVGASASTPAAPVELTFDKSLVGSGVWHGTVGGDIAGDLETRLTDLRVSGPIWHVRFEWEISADDRSFVADLRGTLNTDTGDVVMNGTVVDGFLLGARVHEEGQLVDAAALRFQGTIRIMPATAVGSRSR